MAGETQITIIGNMVADAELRFTPSGSAVANFSIASTPRTFDRQANEWKDDEALFMRCSLWREAAENAAETLTKGMRVIAQGRLRARSYDTKEGDRRTVMELEVDEIGPSLRFASAVVTRTQRSGGQGGGNQGGGGGYQQQPAQGGGGYQQAPQQQQPPQQGGGWNAPAGDPWQQGGQGGQQAPQQGGYQQQPNTGQAPPQPGRPGNQGGGWGNPGTDEPPF